MVKTVMLDYGHGGNDPGARGNGYNEKDLARDVGKLVKKELERAGVKVYETRKGDETVSLRGRSDYENRIRPDIFVSLHLNSFGKESAQGLETYSYSGANNNKGANLAKAIQDELIKNKLYTKNRGVKKQNFHVLRETNSPAALCEMVFISNKEDVKLLVDNKGKFGKAIAKGILNHLNVKNDVKPSKPSKPAQKPNKPSLKSVNAVAKEVVAGKWGNNPKRKQDLEKAGYNYSAVQKEVNKIVSGGTATKPKKKSTATIAQEVIGGKWGNGADRKKRLESAGYNFSTIQKEVNRKLGATAKKPKKSNKQVALEIYRGVGNWGTGKTRQNRLKKAGYNASAVQREVNKLFK